MWVITFPRTVVTGEDALEYLKEIEGARALIVTDKVIRKLNFAEKVINYLKTSGLQVEVFDEVEPEPSMETMVNGAEFAKKHCPDWIIGLGGGSCMDAAKAIWVLYERPDMTVDAINPLEKLGLRKKARLICIPTTSGTGSDATWATIITDAKERRKLELTSREMVADITLLDPELPKSMPPRLVADTGMDALTHAVEGYVSQWRNDFSDALAIRAIQFIFKYLLRAYRNPEDKEAKEKMHNAATMAGISFSNSQVGIAHAMGHSLGAIFSTPHGRCVSLFLPYSIEYSAREAMQRYADIAKEIGIHAEAEEEAVKKLIKAVKELCHNLEEPSSIRDLGISREDFERDLEELVVRAANSSCTFMNPRVPDVEDMRKLFICAYEGKEVDF
ncbi:MAG: iron-containing alcohol dehydrogenase [Candidatus Bathycorpusculaceae bacterium]